MELVEIEGYDINDTTSDPWEYKQSALHWAAKGGHTCVVRYLLDRGAQVRSIDASGSYPLHLACRAGHLEVAPLLVRATGELMDLFVRDYDADMTPLEWSLISDNTTMNASLIRELDRMWMEYG